MHFSLSCNLAFLLVISANIIKIFLKAKRTHISLEGPIAAAAAELQMLAAFEQVEISSN